MFRRGLLLLRVKIDLFFKSGASLRVNEKDRWEIVPLSMAYPYYNFSISKLY